MQRLTRVIGFLTVVLAPSLIVTGCCMESTSRLTDGEYIRRAIYYNAADMGLRREDGAIESFLAQHPACCRVERDSHMAGWNYVVVELNYEKQVEALFRDSEPFYKQYVEITACGKRGAIYGEGTKALESASNRSPDAVKRNPGLFSAKTTAIPDSVSLHPGYDSYNCSA